MFCKHEMRLRKVLMLGLQHFLAVDLENIYYISNIFTSFHKTRQSCGSTDNELGENKHYYNEQISL